MANLHIESRGGSTRVHDTRTNLPLDWQRFELRGVAGETPYLVVELKGVKPREGRTSVDVEMEGAVVEPEPGAMFTAEEQEFVSACHDHMRRLGMGAFSPLDALTVARSMGYRKTAKR